ncbi:unnamed protein product [Mycetohabitans rhizoxinica HKI 454]|uniref:Uncharacterized protein n=1 Tax=Mycetohabitans rhizoxinica (strain DSM 19002 / CIP 109453 / HKI 454) TaxID=882378 RepID=E5ARH8_MYCRK|nr:unnamed protein product [Mycetohabitans rhizoxinica HKI 454]
MSRVNSLLNYLAFQTRLAVPPRAFPGIGPPVAWRTENQTLEHFRTD